VAEDFGPSELTVKHFVRKQGNAFITIHILVLVHLDVCGSLLARLTVVTSPVIRVVSVSIRRPLSLNRLTGGDVKVGRSGLSSVA